MNADASVTGMKLWMLHLINGKRWLKTWRKASMASGSSQLSIRSSDWKTLQRYLDDLKIFHL